MYLIFLSFDLSNNQYFDNDAQASVYNFRAVARFGLGKNMRGLNDLDLAIPKVPYDTEVHLNKALYLIETSNLSEAEVYVNRIDLNTKSRPEIKVHYWVLSHYLYFSLYQKYGGEKDLNRSKYFRDKATTYAQSTMQSLDECKTMPFIVLSPSLSNFPLHGKMYIPKKLYMQY